jgi:bifunctional DNA-binding transcriptional regulator/antitoxin component of YhaV-PrlF toxin-antitoxin module
MAKVTSKLQVTVPKALATQYGIRPGVEIEWEPAGDTIRVIPPGQTSRTVDLGVRLRLFDAATERQKTRQGPGPAKRAPKGRGWRREELYDRGRAR